MQGMLPRQAGWGRGGGTGGEAGFPRPCSLPKAALSDLENCFSDNLPSLFPASAYLGVNFCLNTSLRKQNWKECLIFQNPKEPSRRILV